MRAMGDRKCGEIDRERREGERGGGQWEIESLDK